MNGNHFYLEKKIIRGAVIALETLLYNTWDKKKGGGGEKYKKFLEMATATRSGQKVITVGSEVI